MKEIKKNFRIDAIQGNKELSPEPYSLIRREESDEVDTVERNPKIFLKAYIGIGANLGDRQKNIETAVAEIAQFAQVTKTATIIETEPETDKTQPNFLNTVIEIQTDLPPTDLLIRLLEIEHKMGRVRSKKNAAREIDLDILLYGDEIINQPNLQIPHPRMHKRPFVTMPLEELLQKDEMQGKKERPT